METKQLVLIFGATGRTGYHIVNRLLEHGYAIRIVARDKNKVAKLFKGKQASFQKVVLGSLKDENTFKLAFEPSQIYGNVAYVISALGSVFGGKQSAEELQYLSQVRIIEKCQQVGIKKYVLISALLVGRPWHPVSAVLNTIIPDILLQKSKAQNYLRSSGLNYAIIRPPSLLGDEKDMTVTPYKTFQQKQFNGSITRCTVAKLIQDVIQSEQIPSKVTFDCVGTAQKNEIPLQNLKQDTEFSIQKSNHRSPKYAYGILLLLLSVYVINVIAHKFLGSQKV